MSENLFPPQSYSEFFNSVFADHIDNCDTGYFADYTPPYHLIRVGSDVYVIDNEGTAIPTDDLAVMFVELCEVIRRVIASGDMQETGGEPQPSESPEAALRQKALANAVLKALEKDPDKVSEALIKFIRETV